VSAMEETSFYLPPALYLCGAQADRLQVKSCTRSSAG
jgi:hypothetical protein